MDSNTEAYRSNVEIQNSMNELKRRVDVTRRARFACSTRLRNYSNKIQNLIIYYNILIVFISIITMYRSYGEGFAWYTYVILSFSITLSFFATHIAGKNYKEKAIQMESNGHELTKIHGKIEVSQSKLEFKPDNLSNLFKEYERILINVENHDKIDYLNVKVDKIQQV